MKNGPGYSPAVFYDASIVKKIVLGLAMCSIIPFTLVAQDSLRLKSIKDSNIYYSPLVFVNAKIKTGQQPAKKGPYLFVQNTRFNPDTAAIKERYKPGVNPRLLWSLYYPFTEDQRRAKEEEQRREEKIGRQIADDVLQTIFSRKKIPAVKPTF